MQFFKEAKDDGRDAVNFAYACAFIEHEGLLFHNKMIEQMKKSFPDEEFYDWHINKKVSDYKIISMTFSEYISSEYSGHHIDYYRNYYEESIRPKVLDTQNETINERMLALQNTGEITIGTEGKFIKKDGKWAVLAM